MLRKILAGTSRRSLKAYKNIIGLFALKGINVAIGFVLVPLTLNYLDPTRYGIWITLSGIFNWFSLFDIGLGNGLRNKLAEALAKNDIEKARVYISTTYASLFFIFLTVFLLFLIANIFINWTVILNTPKELQEELHLLAGIVFFFFCMRFVTQLIGTIASARQEPAFSQLLDVAGRIVSLIGIYILTLYTDGSLIYLGIILTASPVITLLIISYFVFHRRYKEFKPSFYLIKFKELRYILKLGIKFFVVQIAAIIFYQTNNIIISQLFGPAEVTSFNIAFQYLSLGTFAFMTILTPYWSAFTDAFTKGETEWIRKVMKNLKLLWVGLFFFFIILFLLSDFLIKLWVGNIIVVNKNLYIVIGIYLLINALNGIYSNFMNGVGKIMIQFYTAISLAIFHIPLAILFGKKFGIMGTMFSLIIFGMIQIVLFEKQYRKIINYTDTGVWSK